MYISTGSEALDQQLDELIQAFEDTFPNRILGYFLEGSYADQSALATSDIDLILVFKNSFLHDALNLLLDQLSPVLAIGGYQ